MVATRIAYHFVCFVDLRIANPLVLRPSNSIYSIDRRRTFAVAAVADAVVVDGIVVAADSYGNRRISTNYLRTFGLDLNYLKNVSCFAVGSAAIADGSTVAGTID